MKNENFKRRAIERAWWSLDGLSVGDAFGQRYFVGDEEKAMRLIEARTEPAAPWEYTDDTEMALSIVDMLQTRGTIEQDELARLFASRMHERRAYGQGASSLLRKVKSGRDWRSLAQAGFGGKGSFGNGAAMRVAPLGAYCAEEPLEIVIDQARLSAEITHGHEEGVAGAIAVAVAAALAWRQREAPPPLGEAWLRAVREATPKGYVRSGIDLALQLEPGTSIFDAAVQLGNGSGITAPDTVPLCLWIAARSTDVETALWDTVSALGDRDTTCAIVGGILPLSLGHHGIPQRWLTARETLPLERPA
jgi:ADP-ribosylglycohydrolase